MNGTIKANKAMSYVSNLIGKFESARTNAMSAVESLTSEISELNATKKACERTVKIVNKILEE